MLPRLAIVDPELTRDLPQDITAATGLDALTQLIEAFVCRRANPMTDGFCREGIARVARSLRQACNQPDDMEAREDMSLGALLGGLALANAGLGAVHGFAGPLGGMFPAPHGAICAILLPHVMAVNLHALRERQPESDALNRYDETARILLGNQRAAAEDGVEWVRQLVESLPIPPLGRYGVTVSHLKPIIQKATAASSMKPNPIELNYGELESILASALS
jgi:alcohol dehydrogenase class IV